MDPLYDILAPHLDTNASSSTTRPSFHNDQSTAYLNRLSTLSLSDISSTEPASLSQSAQSHVRSLQALSKRSHNAIISSSSHLERLRGLLPGFREGAGTLQNDLPELESATTKFAQKYDRTGDNEVLNKRKRAMLLSRNVDRVSDVLELPTLLSSTVSAAQATNTASSSSSATSYVSALDLHAHIRRLNGLYPKSELVGGISKQAEAEITNLTNILITTLQSPGLKLAAAMRTVGWLRRVAPELTDENASAAKPGVSSRSFDASSRHKSGDGALGSLFLVCRLHALHTMLEALTPLRDLADQESNQRKSGKPQTSSQTSSGTQSERYVKRYIEIFREQSFGIVSMYKSVFPNDLPAGAQDDAEKGSSEATSHNGEPLLPLPPPVASFTLHLVDMLAAVLKEYMPNITDKSARESLLTQVLYCAGSLGRLGADFGMVLALMEEEMSSQASATEEPEWVTVMKKHRVQAGRLEVLARGVGSGARKGSAQSGATSPGVPSPVAAG